jgi:hypothetical protein
VGCPEPLSFAYCRRGSIILAERSQNGFRPRWKERSIAMQEIKPTLFVWRIHEESDPNFDGYVREMYYSLFSRGSEYRQTSEFRCPFCAALMNIEDLMHLEERPTFRGLRDRAHKKHACQRCGFVRTFNYFHTSHGGEQIFSKKSVLRNFSIDDAAIALDELGSHLRDKFDDIYALSSARFEALVSDIYKSIGYQVRMTQQTRDGGYDLLLVEASSGEQILVECKRYAKSRKVGVTTVRQLLGVQIIRDVQKAKLVTSSTFTNPAYGEVELLRSHSPDFSLDLVDAEALLREMGVYNTALPRMDLVVSSWSED